MTKHKRSGGSHMDPNEFIRQSDEDLVLAVKNGDFAEKLLLNDDVWNHLTHLCHRHGATLGWAALAQLEKSRVRAFCDLRDGLILRSIQTATVPLEVLKDKEGWRRICQVRGANKFDVTSDQWRTICTRRGETGVPPGPY